MIVLFLGVLAVLSAFFVIFALACYAFALGRYSGISEALTLARQAREELLNGSKRSP